MGRLKFFTFCFGLAATLACRAQSPKDTTIAMHLVCFQFSAQQPGGDLKERYGNNFDVGLSYFYKTRKNLLLGIDPHYFFSRNVKEDVLAHLRTDQGTITNSDGNFADIIFNQRGWNVTLSAGKVLPKFGKIKISANPNSGLMLMGGVGYLQHKIHLLDESKKVPQLEGDYKKGYDRLTGGIVFKEFIGYMHLSNNRLINVFAGFEFYQGITKSLRTYNYDQQMADTATRLDLLYGFRIGWILPVYRRAETDNLFNY